jgi:hypothetical protein
MQRKVGRTENLSHVLSASCENKPVAQTCLPCKASQPVHIRTVTAEYEYNVVAVPERSAPSSDFDHKINPLIRISTSNCYADSGAGR